MSTIRPMAVISAIGATVGGAVGFALGGPAGIKEGAQLGFGLGVQTAVVNKGDQAVDETAKKISEGLDAAGRKVEIIADKTGGAIELIGNAAAGAIEKTADIWSKLMLTGYAINISFNGVNQSMGNYNLFCKSAFESIQCASMSLTTVSFNVVAACAGMGLIYQIYKISK